jgi:hypothetical protein
MEQEEDLRRQAKRRIQDRRAFWQDLVSYVIVNAALIGIWAVTGGGYFWPGWVLFAWGIGLAFHAWNTFGQKPITDEQIRREMDRLRQQQDTR